MSDNQLIISVIVAFLIGCAFGFSVAKADPLPPHIAYLCKHWLETDRFGNQLGYNLKQFAIAASEDGEFKTMCGYDAGHYRRLSNNRLVWVANPNKVIVECAEIRMKWDNEKWLHYVSGELYIEPSLADANQIAEEWMNR